MGTDRTLTVLHAGMVTNLVERGLAPALASEGVAVENTRGHSVGLANGIKEGRYRGDVFLSAGAPVNDTLMGAANGDWVRWYVVFAHNAVVLEAVAKMAYNTLTLKHEAAEVSQALLDRHYFRKHGANATYGQSTPKS